MQNNPVLLPAPHILILTDGACYLSAKSQIFLAADQADTLSFSARRLQAALEHDFHLKLEFFTGADVPLAQAGITLRVEPHAIDQPQGYRLVITPAGVRIEGHDESGVFYACCTLIQLIQYYSALSAKNHDLPISRLPCLEIQDWPDLPHRGVMLDISRDRVPTLDTVFSLVDLLGSWKINQLQLYTEHTFAYRSHPEVWASASPFTSEEILALDAYCRERFIELVPNQNSFGHMERWLIHPRYRSLAETIDGDEFHSGDHLQSLSLCPLDPGSLTLLKSLYDELLPNFSSRQLNIGCDETFDLGQGRSKSECERFGVERVYLDFLLKLYQDVSKRGYRVQFWGDIVMAHPELVEELPKDMIALDWGYEANYTFGEHGEIFAAAGIPFYVCPGTSSWNSIAGRTDNCLKNLAFAAQTALDWGATGYLNTDWGDNGHWQCLPVSYLGFAAGAAFSWAYQANRTSDIQAALNQYAFLDPSGNMGRLAYELGNLYRSVGVEPDNASFLFEVLQNPIHSWLNSLPGEEAVQTFRHTLDIINQLTTEYPSQSSLRPDKDILEAEFKLTVDMLRHACMRASYGFGSTEFNRQFLSADLHRIIAEYPHVWLPRSRSGGLVDSLSYFDTAMREYQSDLA